MQRVKASQGLLVSWGGFTKDAIQENRTDFFSIRLWDQGDIINEIVKYYDKFDSETKTELPLKKIWTLVEEELE
jgi:restriction system protein